MFLSHRVELAAAERPELRRTPTPDQITPRGRPLDQMLFRHVGRVGCSELLDGLRGNQDRTGRFGVDQIDAEARRTRQISTPMVHDHDTSTSTAAEAVPRSTGRRDTDNGSDRRGMTAHGSERHAD